MTTRQRMTMLLCLLRAQMDLASPVPRTIPYLRDCEIDCAVLSHPPYQRDVARVSDAAKWRVGEPESDS